MNTPHEFGALHAALRRAQAAGFAQPVVLATVLRTRGPVFRRAGARMLIHADGSTVRSLAGGCPEADIINRAAEVATSGRAAIVRYDNDSGLDVLLEMGCGGALDVLLEPIASNADFAFVSAVGECLRRRCRGWLATVIGSGQAVDHRPRHVVGCAQDILLDESGDERLGEALRSLSPAPEAPAQVLTLETDSGPREVLVEPLQPPLALGLIGVHATSEALARLGSALGWQVTLVETRGEDAPRPDLPADIRLIHARPQNLPQLLAPDDRSAIVVMTHNLERDIECLQALAGTPLAYLGAIGSRDRAKRLYAATRLPAERLHSPAGLDIGAETPEEIALAVAAEIQATLTRRSGHALGRGTGPLH